MSGPTKTGAGPIPLARGNHMRSMLDSREVGLPSRSRGATRCRLLSRCRVGPIPAAQPAARANDPLSTRAYLARAGQPSKVALTPKDYRAHLPLARGNLYAFGRKQHPHGPILRSRGATRLTDFAHRRYGLICSRGATQQFLQRLKRTWGLSARAGQPSVPAACHVTPLGLSARAGQPATRPNCCSAARPIRSRGATALMIFATGREMGLSRSRGNRRAVEVL